MGYGEGKRFLDFIIYVRVNDDPRKENQHFGWTYILKAYITTLYRWRIWKKKLILTNY